MDVDKLKDYALLIKNTFRSSKNYPLEIFYHESNYCKLLSPKEVNSSINIYTPVYTDKEGISFRGFIQACDIDHLTLGLECSIKIDSSDTIVEWSVSIYNTAKDEYLLLGYSKKDLLSGDPMSRSEVKVAVSFLETYIQGNPIVFKWNVQTLSLSKETGDIEESQSGNIDIDTSIDALVQHLSDEVFRDDDHNNDELNSVKKEMWKCQNKQNLNEEKLQTIEHQCLDIDKRLGHLLEKIDFREQCVSHEISHRSYLRNTDNQRTFLNQNVCLSPSENNSKLKRSASDSMLYLKYFSSFFSAREDFQTYGDKISKTSETETFERLALEDEEIIPLTKSTQTDLEGVDKELKSVTASKMYELKEEELYLKKKVQLHEPDSFYRSKYTDYRMVADCRDRRILFLGTNLRQMERILQHLFHKDISAIEPGKLLKVVCEREGIELYVGHITNKPTCDGLINLMTNSQNVRLIEFHGCVCVLNYFSQILDSFNKRFYKKYLISIINKDRCHFQHIDYWPKSIILYKNDYDYGSYFYRDLIMAIAALSQRCFTFNETILTQHFKELFMKDGMESIHEKLKRSYLEKKPTYPFKGADFELIHGDPESQSTTSEKLKPSNLEK